MNQNGHYGFCWSGSKYDSLLDLLCEKVNKSHRRLEKDKEFAPLKTVAPATMVNEDLELERGLKKEALSHRCLKRV